jgi:hypothetical protein
MPVIRAERIKLVVIRVVYEGKYMTAIFFSFINTEERSRRAFHTPYLFFVPFLSDFKLSLPNRESLVMAEMANALAFSAYEEKSSIYSGISPPNETPGSHGTKIGSRDSGVFLSDAEELPTVTAPLHGTSTTLKSSSSMRSTLLGNDSARPDRLRRPADLDLSSPVPADGFKPKSELQLKYDMIRNSQTRSKAALKSPTQLLNDRLNLSPKGKTHETVRIFTPPRPMLNGCILPGPASHLEAFSRRDICARTESGRQVWWCKVDKVVVFDGVQDTEDGGLVFLTRSSKGLSIARRRGDLETVVIPMECQHCQQMLNRRKWKYDVHVCKRSVCWECKERCGWELERKNIAEATSTGIENQKQHDAKRPRTDSVMQDERMQEDEWMERIGDGVGLESASGVIGGIQERLNKTETVEGT